MCSIENVQYWEDSTQMFSIDSEGEPTMQIDHTDGDFRCYHCDDCGEEFQEWEEVLTHVNEENEDE